MIFVSVCHGRPMEGPIRGGGDRGLYSMKNYGWPIHGADDAALVSGEEKVVRFRVHFLPSLPPPAHYGQSCTDMLPRNR